MKILRVLFAPLGILYWCITSFRNFLFNQSIFKSAKFEKPIIVIGNLSTGGTGKSPITLFLTEHLSSKVNLAVLSRGYGRNGSGHRMVSAEDIVSDVGDEPLQLKRRFPNIPVAVDSNRVRGVVQTLFEVPEIDLFLLDDAYQHRWIKPSFTILLTTFQQPYFNDFILPAGNLRESRAGKKRANIIVVTKCPTDLSQQQKAFFIKKINPASNQKVLFSSVVYRKLTPLFQENTNHTPKGIPVIITGIANYTPFTKYIEEQFGKIDIQFNYSDHHNFQQKEIETWIQYASKHSNRIFITTEKDAMRLLSHKDQLTPLLNQMYILPIDVKFHGNSLEKEVDHHLKCYFNEPEF